MQEPELTANVQLTGGGAFCGRELLISPATDVTSITLDFAGEPMRYDFDPCDALWHHVPPRRAPAGTGDRAFDVIVTTIGEEKLAELLALVAVRQMCEGKIDWWQLLAARIDRMRETS